MPIVALLVMTGCAAFEPPENHDARLYDPEKTGELQRMDLGMTAELSFPTNHCPPAGTSDFIMPPLRGTYGKDVVQARALQERLTMRFSPGDRFNLLVPGSQEFSGDYVVNADGTVILPFASTVPAIGLTHVDLAKRIEAEFVRSALFRDGAFRVSVRPVQYAPINVSVTGAVFYPGRNIINNLKDSDKLASVLAKFGDSPTDRFIAAAMRSAGGVRPDADLSNVKLKRDGRTFTLNWRGALTGEPVDDVALIEGDQIHVEEASCFQSALVRPSQITPPGIRIFQSNLTQPALNNAASAVGRDSQSVPYGTRFLAGLVSSNCVGGAMTSNARRYGVLISRNPKTMKTEVIQRSIEELVRSADRDVINPYLMPDDAIACYDSGVTEAREVATTLQTLLGPLSTVVGARNTLLYPGNK